MTVSDRDFRPNAYEGLSQLACLQVNQIKTLLVTKYHRSMMTEPRKRVCQEMKPANLHNRFSKSNSYHIALWVDPSWEERSEKRKKFWEIWISTLSDKLTFPLLRVGGKLNEHMR